MAKISIIIPVLDSANRVDELLGTLLVQKEKDIEIICVAPIESEFLKLLNNYALFDERVRVLCLQKGQQWMRIALAAAKAPYVMFLRPCSMVAFAFLEYMLCLAGQMPDIDFVYAPLLRKDEFSYMLRKMSDIVPADLQSDKMSGSFPSTLIYKEFLKKSDKQIYGKLIRADLLRVFLSEKADAFNETVLFYACLYKGRRIAWTVSEMVFEWENADPFAVENYKVIDQKLKISVIIPVYNAEQHLSRCLDALRLQTYNNLEIICVNDGSTDGTAKILQKYADEDSRIKVITQQNKGVSAARNTALQAVTSDFVSMVDADDCVSLALYQKFVSILQQEKRHIDLFQFNGIRFFDMGCNNPLLIYALYNPYAWGDFFEGHIKDFRKVPALGDDLIWNKIYRTEMLRKNNIKFAEGLIFEDRIFALEAHIKANGIYLTENYMYFYRQHPTSITHRLTENIFDFFKVMDIFEDILRRENYYENVKYIFFDLVVCEASVILLSTKSKHQERVLQMTHALLRRLQADIDINVYLQIGTYKEFYNDLHTLNVEQLNEKYKNALFVQCQ